MALAKLTTKPGTKKSSRKKGKESERHGPKNARRTLPAFLFPSYLDYDPDAKDRGLGQSALMVKVRLELLNVRLFLTATLFHGLGFPAHLQGPWIRTTRGRCRKPWARST